MSGCSKAVLIVDDNDGVRRAIRVFLEHSAQIQVCGEAVDGAEAIRKANELKPGLILMDLSMPTMNGLEAAWAIKRAMPDARIVVFSLYSGTLNQAMAKQVGIDLVVSKADGAAGLLKALQLLSFDDPASVH